MSTCTTHCESCSPSEVRCRHAPSRGCMAIRYGWLLSYGRSRKYDTPTMALATRLHHCEMSRHWTRQKAAGEGARGVRGYRTADALQSKQLHRCLQLMML